MGVKSGQIEASLAAVATINPTVRKNFDRPEADVRRWQTVSIQTDRAPTLDGHPHLPALWFRATPVLSATGEYVLGSRPRPSELAIGSDVRFLVTDDTWDPTTGIWTSWSNTGQTWYFRGNLATLPTRNQVSYRIGREVISVSRFQFTGGQFFYSDFMQGSASAVAFTMSMVVMLDPAPTSRYALLDWGIPGWTNQVPEEDERTYIGVSENIEYSWADFSGKVNQVVPISRLAPAFITMVVNPPFVDVYVSMGMGFTFRTSGSTTHGSLATKLKFFLGKSIYPMDPSSFSLLEFNIWDNALTPDEVGLLNSTYTSAYGASHDRT